MFTSIFSNLGLFNSQTYKDSTSVEKQSPYVINTKVVKNGKLQTRELLLRANPLHGDKITQKASQGTCVYNALNYIRTRYKQCAQEYPKERAIEKSFSECRKKSTDLELCFIRFKLIFDHWVEEDKICPRSLKSLQEWIDFMTRKVAERIEISSESCSKERNDYLLSETYKHIEGFIKLIKMDKSSSYAPASFTANHIKEFIDNYDKHVVTDIRENILEQYLKLNVPTIIREFLEERGVYDYSDNINGFIKAIGRSNYNGLIQKVFFDQEAKLNGLNYFENNITKSISTLLNVIESTGPLVFVASGNIAKHTKTSFIKSVSNYPILQLTFGTGKSKANHALVLVGGGIDKSKKKFVYIIDPNDSYTAQYKVPIYRISFTKFKKALSTFDAGYLVFNDKSYFMEKNYFIYSKDGLNLTRDPTLDNTNTRLKCSIKTGL